jgi:UDP-glucose 4-epimerase
MTKPCVLVTGGAGVIGSHAVLALLDAGYPVVVVDNLVTGFSWAVDARAAFVEADINDDDKVRTALRDHRVGAIMHFAGSVVVPESVSDPLKYYRNNTAASRALIESAVACEVKHFIFSSTATTYGTPERVPIAETDPTRPINPYGMSKLMTEAMLKDVAQAHAFNFCALRYFDVAGADQDARAGQSTTGATHVIKVAVEAALCKRDHVGVFGTDFETNDGTGLRDYIHVCDLAAAHVNALELLLEKPTHSHILDCGYGHGYSVLQVLDAVDRVTNMMINRRFDGGRPGNPAALIADNSAILGAVPCRPFYDDLERIVGNARRGGVMSRREHVSMPGLQ